MHFQILIFDGFDELDAIASFEVLKDAVRTKESGLIDE
jgi:putative intracellular protease/amidase